MTFPAPPTNQMFRKTHCKPSLPLSRVYICYYYCLHNFYCLYSLLFRSGRRFRSVSTKTDSLYFPGFGKPLRRSGRLHPVLFHHKRPFQRCFRRFCPVLPAYHEGSVNYNRAESSFYACPRFADLFCRQFHYSLFIIHYSLVLLLFYRYCHCGRSRLSCLCSVRVGFCS
jgi:hypothetical protein